MHIVLVHGAWGGSWCWKEVRQLLTQHGHQVYAPNLTGVGFRHDIPPDQIDLNTHIEEVAGLLRFERLTDVLLVGHSYGGMVTTGAADRDISRIRGMVYLDAFLPDSGQSLWDIIGTEGAERQRLGAENHDGGKSLPYHFGRPGEIPSSPDRPYTPQPLRTLNQPYISQGHVRTWPNRHYVACRYSPQPHFRNTYARLDGALGWSVEMFDAAHDAPMTHPEPIAEIIATMARNWA